MIVLRKWDYKTEEYLPFVSPANHVVLYSEDMDLKIDCTNCGKEITFGVGYTSRRIHNHSGLGFPVCDICHEKEIKLEKEFI